jgi:hypothetical protein
MIETNLLGAGQGKQYLKSRGSVVAISVLIALGGQVKGVFTTITSQLAVAGNGGRSSGGPPTQGGGG